MGKGTCADELIDYFKMDADTIPSHSAAFLYLFKKFSSAFPQTTHIFKDNCILACDGTHVVYSTNSEIIEDFNMPRVVDHKGYNHMHLNAFVDVVSKAILDVVIQPGQKTDERAALHTMLDPFKPECPDSSKSILSSFTNELPEDQDEYDITIKRYFTNKYTNEMKERPQIYHYMNPSKNIPHFLPLLDNRHLVYLNFRVVKLKAPDGSVEYLITNLPFTFSMEDIRACYHWRWGCEVSFRYLKHAAGLLYFHSKLPEFLLQEFRTRQWQVILVDMRGLLL